MSDPSVALVDSHCHLDAEYFDEGPDEVIERARAAGVVHVVVVGVGADRRAAQHAVELAARRTDVTAIVGMHPHEAAKLDEPLLQTLADLAARPEVAAVGEIGLDYHYMFSPKVDQQRVFREMVRLARGLGKPIVVHTREAADDTWTILDEEHASEVGGIIHCFSEDLPFAERAIDGGFDLSFSGIVTYKNARAIQHVASWVPSDRYLVETDSPYLAPVPVRGRRCEPAYVVHTARRVAELRGESLGAVAADTTRNAARRLGRKIARSAADEVSSGVAGSR